MSVGAETKPVPAWQRLGLKLKRSHDDIGSKEPSEDVATPPTKKTKTSNKTAASTIGTKTNGSSHLVFDDSDNPGPHVPIQPEQRSTPKLAPVVALESTEESAQSGSKRKRAKSVTFAPDTKATDGSTVGSYNAPSTDPVIVEESLQAQTVSDVKPEKRKKERKAKATKGADENSEAPLYVQYLVDFHRNRVRWKFNKAKQIDVLKNLWNLHRIPPTHDDALVAYLGGLQGEAARKRVTAEARKVLSDATATPVDDSKIASATSQPPVMTTADRIAARRESIRADLEKQHRNGYGPAVTDEILDQQIEEAKKAALLREHRAERILVEALKEELGKKEKPSGGRALKKRRSQANDDGTSSEDDPSSSEEESSSDETESSSSEDESSSSEESSSDESITETNDSSSARAVKRHSDRANGVSDNTADEESSDSRTSSDTESDEESDQTSSSASSSSNAGDTPKDEDSLFHMGFINKVRPAVNPAE